MQEIHLRVSLLNALLVLEETGLRKKEQIKETRATQQRPSATKNKPSNDIDLSGFCESETGVVDVKRLEEG